MDVPIRHHVGVEIFYRELPHFVVEAHQNHGLNIVSFQLETRYRCWFVVGCYLPLDNDTSIKCFIGEMVQHPCKAELLVVGNLNTNLGGPEGSDRDEVIA